MATDLGTNGRSTLDDAHQQAIESIFAELDKAAPLPAAMPIVAHPPTPIAPKQRAPVFDHNAYRPVRHSQRQTVNEDEGRWDWVSDSLRWVMIALGIFLIATSVPGSPFHETPIAYTVVRQPVEVEEAKPIQDVQVGDRTTGKNPLRDQADTSIPDPDPKTWRKLSLRMTKESGKLLHVTVLRDLDWIEAAGAVEGESFFLDLPEMGAVGDALVLSIEPCPPIHRGSGNVVTGTFHHEADPGTRLLRVEFSNGSEFTGVTDNHPIYSVRHHDFVAIGELREGDYVKLRDSLTRIEKIEARIAPGGQMLYNIETHREHVYEVNGILVHNSCVPSKLTQSQSDAYRRAARNTWETRTGARASASSLDVHHRIPLEWAHKFPHADPIRAANLLGVRRGADHEALNRAWAEFKTSLNGRDPSAAQVMRKAIEIDELFGHLFHFLP